MTASAQEGFFTTQQASEAGYSAQLLRRFPRAARGRAVSFRSGCRQLL